MRDGTGCWRCQGVGRAGPCYGKGGQDLFCMLLQKSAARKCLYNMIKKKCLNNTFNFFLFYLGLVFSVDLNCRYLSGLYSIPCLPDFSSLNINHFNKKKECFKILVNISHCCISEGK